MAGASKRRTRKEKQGGTSNPSTLAPSPAAQTASVLQAAPSPEAQTAQPAIEPASALVTKAKGTPVYQKLVLDEGENPQKPVSSTL